MTMRESASFMDECSLKSSFFIMKFPFPLTGNAILDSDDSVFIVMPSSATMLSFIVPDISENGDHHEAVNLSMPMVSDGLRSKEKS